MSLVTPLLAVLLTAPGPGLDAPLHAARYLRAQALAEQGRLGPASEELELLAVKSPELADRAAFEAGALFERRGGLRKASALYAAVSPQSYFFEEARLAQARVDRLRGDFAGAKAAVAPVTQSANRSARRRALVELTQLADAANDARARADALTAITLDRARWLGGAPVLAMLSRDHDELIERNMCKDAQRFARRVPSGLSCVSRLLTAEAAACKGKDVSTDLRRLARTCPQPEIASRAVMTLATLQGRAGHMAGAAERFREVARIAPSSPLAADALFAAFWTQWRTQPDRASADDLLRLDALPVELSSQDRARVGYWRARVARSKQAPAEEAGLLADVVRRYPSTYYGRLSRERLAEMQTVPASPVEEPASAAKDAREAQALLAPGIAALQLGLDDAADELATIALRAPSPAVNRLAVEVLNAAGATREVHRFGRAVFRAQPGQHQDVTVWQAAFPTDYSTLLALKAEETNVTPALLQGLVREESAFNPEAKSWCGARGLMQLMPVTARALAVEVGDPLGSLDELMEPKRNVELGSRYLGQLLRRFDGNPAVAAAAYNGGPTRVARWLELADEGHLEEWIEELPLDETRNYAKDVLASADVYRHRLADRAVVLAAVGGPVVSAQP